MGGTGAGQAIIFLNLTNFLTNSAHLFQFRKYSNYRVMLLLLMDLHSGFFFPVSPLICHSAAPEARYKLPMRVVMEHEPLFSGQPKADRTT